ncbi:epsin-2-like [Artemia franciscana]|uniref:ENTH domain-containing protein n=1 Tax=Artemia franciscana TaxID=6661 RepID=A0AA88HIR1_ARTSF|nr:hypothetical protein QYM36_015476 [Artemia franciscana]
MKNILAGYSYVEILAREATCSDMNDPAPEMMTELARLTLDNFKMLQVMNVIKTRLGDLGNSRHIYKAAKLLDYLFKFNGDKLVEYSSEWWYDKAVSLLSHKDDNIRYVIRDLVVKVTEWKRMSYWKNKQLESRDNNSQTQFRIVDALKYQMMSPDTQGMILKSEVLHVQSPKNLRLSENECQFPCMGSGNETCSARNVSRSPRSDTPPGILKKGKVSDTRLTKKARFSEDERQLNRS